MLGKDTIASIHPQNSTRLTNTYFISPLYFFLFSYFSQ
ncbi:hypothetical protein M111_1425 [Bacteroides fragilis str. 3986T(B)10]|nr:hypothetical protein M111_1425 [Bacteroides fragilis str. 3986T(B)10]